MAYCNYIPIFRTVEAICMHTNIKKYIADAYLSLATVPFSQSLELA